MRPSIAPAVGRLGTEGAFAVLARARALEATGRDVIHLEIGEPDFETPPHVAEAGIAAIRAGETHYCQTAGLPGPARGGGRVARRLARRRDRSRRTSLVANGAKPFLFFTVLATCGPGDEVIYPDPGFPIYESAVRFAGATPVPLPLREERGFSFDPAELEQLLSERTRLVILNAPQNPTGGVIPQADLRARRGGDRANAGLGAHRRGVLADHLRRRGAVDRVAAGDARAHGPARRLLEDVRDDRLAARLRRRSGRARRSADAPDRQLDLVRAAVRAARRRRRARGAAGRGRRDGGRVPPPARLPRARR